MSQNNTHITQEELTRFHNNRLSEQELTTFLQHIAECTYCADQFAESFEPVLIPAPANLKEQILTKAKQKERISKPFRQVSAKEQFFLYSTKVCVAMCGALILLFTISSGSRPTIQALKEKKASVQTQRELETTKSFTSSINTSMNAFATQINNHMSSIVSDTAREKNAQ